METMLKVIYSDENLIVCIKPSGVLSTDEEGGMPDLVREYFHDSKKPVFTVHRLDRIVSGLMVLALNKDSAAAISRQITDGSFDKHYMAVVHGRPEADSGRYDDLLFREKSENKTYVVKRMRKGVRDAALEFEVLGTDGGFSLVRIHLLTGRTHQIRAQFSSRRMPIAGDRKYGALNDGCRIALWSCSLSFNHPITGEHMEFMTLPPKSQPWDRFGKYCSDIDESCIETAERRQFRETQADSAT